MLAFLFAAHLAGDFLLQNDWMQAKSKSTAVCTAHVACYSVPFWFFGLPWWAYSAIMVEHWLQDRFALHLKWMKFYRQTTPDKWPVGPLCIDQSLHLAFMALVCWLGGIK
jgi:hypothetical protein